jgi:hypothetical protein
LKERLLQLQEKLAAREVGEVERRNALKYRKVRCVMCVCGGVCVCGGGGV